MHTLSLLLCVKHSNDLSSDFQEDTSVSSIGPYTDPDYVMGGPFPLP